MSYILEALKKADQDRVIGAVPDLESTHEAVQSKSHSYRWVWIVAPLLIVNGALLAVLLMQPDAVGPDPTKVASEQLAGVPYDRTLQPLPRTPSPRIGATPAPARSPLPKRSEPAVAPKPAAQSRPGPVARKPDPPRQKAVARAATTSTSAAAAPVPNWSELSLETRSEIDLPRLDVHVYSEQPQRRFILVDLDKYQEGETLESGLVLEKILPNGIVLSHEGLHFQLDK